MISADFDAFRAVLVELGAAALPSNASAVCQSSQVRCDADRRIVKIDVTLQNLTGRLSPRVGELRRLTELVFARNNVSGPLPDELFDLTALSILSLWGNLPLGAGSRGFPPRFGRMTQLVELRAGLNGWVGEIPSEIALCSQLRLLHLSDNALVGGVEPLARLSRLTSLRLDGQAPGAGLVVPTLPAIFAGIDECYFVSKVGEPSCTDACGNCCMRPAPVAAMPCPTTTTTTTTTTSTTSSTTTSIVTTTAATSVMAMAPSGLGTNLIVIVVCLLVVVLLVVSVVALVCWKRRAERRKRVPLAASSGSRVLGTTAKLVTVDTYGAVPGEPLEPIVSQYGRVETLSSASSTQSVSMYSHIPVDPRNAPHAAEYDHGTPTMI